MGDPPYFAQKIFWGENTHTGEFLEINAGLQELPRGQIKTLGEVYNVKKNPPWVSRQKRGKYGPQRIYWDLTKSLHKIPLKKMANMNKGFLSTSLKI